MTNEEQDTAILKKLQELSHRPVVFSELPGDDRQKDRRLQALRRQGLVRYLAKGDGGPGWVI